MATMPSASRRKASKRPPAPAVEMSAASNGIPRQFDPSEGPSALKKSKIPEEEVLVKIKEEPSESPVPVAPPQIVLEWSVEDLAELVTRLSNFLPKNDNAKYSTLVEKLDWDKICFGPYTSSQCKAKWNQVMTRLRRYRTLTDMVGDAREWLKHPWLSYNNSKKQQKHPEMPKKPLTPYFRYFLEKREKYSREHPSMSMTDLAKLLSKKFQQLPEKKKQKYKDSYERESETYKLELERFKKDHPEEFPQDSHVVSGSKANSSSNQTHTAPVGNGGPTKAMTPFQFFTADRLKRPDYLQLDKKEAIERARKQWNVLSDGKRIKWIRKSVQDEHRFGLEANGYAASHPEYKVDSIKTVLSKAEKELKDKYDGKPERPPNSGYSLFSRIMLRELKDVPAKEKMADISRRWKDLDDTERTNYNKQAQKANQRYKEKYAIYLNSLDEEDRQKLLAETANSKGQKKEKPPQPVELVTQMMNGTTNQKDEEGVKKESSKSAAVPPNSCKKPASAMFLFQQERMAISQQKHPGFSKQELMRLIAREFAELPDKKKEKYRKLAEEAKKVPGKSEEVSETTHGKKKLYKGEPKKPPQSGYGVFSSEMLSVLTDIDPKQRMAEIAKRWKAMAPADQDKYKKRAQELTKKYTKDLSKFLNALPEEDLKEYYRLRKGPKTKTNATTPKSQAKPSVDGKAKQKRQKPETESSDEEDGEEETPAGGGEEDSSSEDEGSDQTENEDSGSGSDESGSDSDEEDDSDDDDEEVKKEKQNESSSEESGSESGSSDESSDSGSDSDEEE